MSSTNKENIDLSKEFKETLKDKSKIQNILDAKKQKISKLNTRNVNKWLRSRDQKIKVLEKAISRKDKELEELKKKNKAFSKIIRQNAANQAAYRIKVWYWKRIAKNTNSSISTKIESTMMRLVNVGKWLKSRDQKIKVLEKMISRKGKELEELKKKNSPFPKL